jgi:DNA-binding XRE family transcriptional regulator
MKHGEPVLAPTTTNPAARAARAVRQRRLELGLTQEDLAEAADVSPATVRKVESGTQAHYRDLTCTRLAQALGWDPGALNDLRRPGTSRDTTPAQSTTVNTPGPADIELAALNGKVAQLSNEQRALLLAYLKGLTDAGAATNGP